MGSALDVLANYNPTGFAQRNQLQAGAIQQQAQQTQALQLENVIRQRQLRDSDALTKAYTNVDFNADPATQERQIVQGQIQNGGSGMSILQGQRDRAEYRKNLNLATAEQLKNEGTVNERVSDIWSTVQNSKAEDLPQTWADAAPRLSQLTGQQFDPNAVPDANTIATARGLVTHRGALIEEGLKKQQTLTSAQQEQEAATKTTGEAAANLEAASQRGREQLAREEPGNQAAQLAAMTSEQRAQLGVKQKESELQIKKLNEAIGRHEQLYQLESQRNQRQADEFKANYGDVLDTASPVYGTTPKAAAASRQAKMKADNDFDSAVASARAISDFITQVRTGGPAAKAAARLIPTEGSFVLSTANGSRRINRQEVQAVAGTGDLYDKVVGGVKGALTGVNMTDDVLKSLESLYGGLANNAAKKHADVYGSIDKTYQTHWANTLQQGGGGTGGQRVQWTRDAAGNPIPVGTK